MSSTAGFPPKSVVTTLRVEGLVALIAAVTAYWFLGGNWWLFAVLLLAPAVSPTPMLSPPCSARSAGSAGSPG
jgi:hypothetical protein